MSAKLSNNLVEELLRLSSEQSIFGFILSFRLLDSFLKILNGPIPCCGIWVQLLQDPKQLLLLNSQELDLGSGKVRNLPVSRSNHLKMPSFLLPLHRLILKVALEIGLSAR